MHMTHGVARNHSCDSNYLWEMRWETISYWSVPQNLCCHTWKCLVASLVALNCCWWNICWCTCQRTHGRNSLVLHQDKGGDCYWKCVFITKTVWVGLFIVFCCFPPAQHHSLTVLDLFCASHSPWHMATDWRTAPKWKQKPKSNLSLQNCEIWSFVCCWIQCICVMAGISLYAVVKIVPFSCKILLDFMASLDWIMSLQKLDLLYGLRNVASLQVFV